METDHPKDPSAARFSELIALYLDGCATDAEVGELEARILADDDAKREFVRIAFHGQVLRELAETGCLRENGVERSDEDEAASDEAGSRTDDEREAEMAGLEPGIARIDGVRDPRHGVRYFYALNVAVALITVGLVWFLVSRGERGGDPVSTDAVATLTRAIACDWEESQLPAVAGSPLPAGRAHLRSGWAEITLRSGARAFVEGPADVVLGSDNGLGLDRGHARFHVPDGASGFELRTPDLRLVDLGTEFRVHVDAQGSEAIVIDGAVLATPMFTLDGTDDATRTEMRLTRFDVVQASVSRGSFVQSGSGDPRSPRLMTALDIDLADVVAGGDGGGARRGRGIRPEDGGYTYQFQPADRLGPVGYRVVTWSPFVDGVLVPDGGEGPVVVSSAGHRFEACPDTNGYHYLPIWSGGSVRDQKKWTPTELGGVDYASADHALIAVWCNAGVTFDLDALRAWHGGRRIIRLSAVAGNPGPDHPGRASADVWVIVDGEVRFSYRGIDRPDAAIPVDVVIRDGDRFLTLLGTDGGDGHGGDWTMFGDARLELER